MEQEVKHYEFINSLTGNVIAYVSLPVDEHRHEHYNILERKKLELAALHRINFELIYWQDHDHCIR